MYVRALDDLQRSLNADAIVLDREHITIWLMQFSAGYPLKLEHPVVGKISYSNIQFAGSVILIYDRYVSQVIEDLIEKNLRVFEEALANVELEQLQRVGEQGATLLTSTRQKLRAQASTVKVRLAKSSEGVLARDDISAAGVSLVNVPARIDHVILGIRRKLPPPEKKPVWGWLETFVKTNPTLSHAITFVLGGILTAFIGHLIK